MLVWGTQNHRNCFLLQKFLQFALRLCLVDFLQLAEDLVHPQAELRRAAVQDR